MNFAIQDIIDERYEVVRKKYRRGVIEIYECEDVSLRHPARLLKLAETAENIAELCTAFNRAIILWSSVEPHPNVVSFQRMLSIGSIKILVVDPVERREYHDVSLREHLGRYRLTQRLACDFAIDVCRALIHCQHFQPGYVHGCLSLDNCFLADRNSIRIADLGLFKVQRLAQALSVSDIDRAFIAPEALAADDYDERADIYSVACLLDYLLTDSAADSNREEYGAEAEAKEPNPLQLLDHARAHFGLPPVTSLDRVRQVIERCRSRAPADRIGSLSLLLAELEGLFSDVFGLPSRPLVTVEQYAEMDVRGQIRSNVIFDELTMLDRFERAQSKFQLEQYEVAIQDLDVMIKDAEQGKEDDLLAGPCSMRGVCFGMLAAYDRAFADLDRAIELDPQPEYYRNRLKIELRAQSWQRALADLNVLNDLEPSDIELRKTRADVHIIFGNYRQAVEDYSWALDHTENPEMREAMLFQRGNAWERLGDLEAALQDYSAQLALVPDDADTLLLRANLLAECDRFLEALADFLRLLELRPDFSAAHMGVGQCLLLLGRPEEGLNALDMALRLKPNDGPALTLRGKAQEKLGQLEAAVESYSAALQLVDDVAGIHRALVRVLDELGRHQEAKLHLVEAVCIDQGTDELSPGARAYLDLLYVRSFEEAREFLNEHPEYASADILEALRMLELPESMSPSERRLFADRLDWIALLSEQSQ
jgi:tetratricopeptide (TPR) repeat protein